MPKLGAVEFDDEILDALRDNKLVVFAGAGVSIGSPSNLPSFETLTIDIASGTGLTLGVNEPLDRFLGRLHHKKVNVHERAAQRLTPVGSAPNALHTDLLRLFRKAEDIKLITTNFDLHFETAAQALFGSVPDVYRAPALPLGYRFSGIVHVHGALTHSQDLVLTDADFGRAYLTEGWARRFLVEVFRHYTVLFVGYRHADVVMNYLARALPASRLAGRFALTEEDGNWELLGITPIRFNKVPDGNEYRELYDGVQRLAERTTRGAIDWQSRLAEICNGAPPADEETIGEVEQALRDLHTTRFLTNVARDHGWPKWLNVRKHLDALFSQSELSEKDKLLAWWLAEHYAIEHADELFELIAEKQRKLNPIFWWSIGRELGINKEKFLDESALRQWVVILLSSAPTNADHHVLMWLAEQCVAQSLAHLALKVFLFMGEYRLNIKPGFVWRDQDDKEHGRRLDVEYPLRADDWTLNEVWTKQVKQYMPSIAQPLISGISQELEDINQDLTALNKASREWDPVSFGRAAIEPHEQDEHHEAIDVLIDAARDVLEWLAGNNHRMLDTWIERFVTSDAPLLRRLAIHGVIVHPRKSADERLNWLLSRVGLHSRSEHHEIHRAAALSYPLASPETRQVVVDAVLAYQLPADNDWSAERRTARAHFDWLAWLRQADPECTLLERSLASIRAEYPEWQPSDHPDLTHWSSSGWATSQSPWAVAELLAKTPGDQISDLLNFKGNRFDGPDRDGLITAIKEACKQQPSWAFSLADVISTRSLWTSDLWPAVIRGWQEAGLTSDDWRTLLTIIAKPEVHAAHAHDVADLLYSLVKDDGKPFALDLLESANATALATWYALEPSNHDEENSDWLSRAINRPAGVLTEFWIHGLSLLMHGKTGTERTLPSNYRQWFTMVVQDSTSNGGLGRSVLASQIAFLFGLDEGWTREQIVPLFSDADRNHFRQAWDGFLVWGRLYPALLDVLMPAFIAALKRLDTDAPNRRSRFIEFYTALALFHVNDPTQELLPALFIYGSKEDRIHFASQVDYFLRQMQDVTRQQLWDRWLYRYWQDRLQAVPAALEDEEVIEMLEWLPHLGDSFPAAVSLAVKSPHIRIQHSQLPYDLRKSDLVTRYPAATAELLIYLCDCVVGLHAADLGKIANRLASLPADLKARLNEALARVGANTTIR